MIKKICAVLLMAAMLAVPASALTGETYTPSELPVLSPESSDWAIGELQQAKEADLIVDGLGGVYTVEINRSQFARLVVNLAEKSTGKSITVPSANPFTDATDEWILKANGAGIVSGTSATTFEPEANITREQIAAMFYRAIAYIQQETGKTTLADGGDLSVYTDAGQVSSWAKEAVTALAHNGIMKGTSNTQLSPRGTATIEQGILLVLRAYNTVNGR